MIEDSKFVSMQGQDIFPSFIASTSILGSQNLNQCVPEEVPLDEM